MKTEIERKEVDAIISNYSKDDCLSAILFFGNLFKKEDAYKALIKITDLPRLVEMISYDMFLNKFNSYHSKNKEYDNWKLLLSYAQDLKKGYVNFKHYENNI
jgi:hypothetical protein